MFAAPANVVYFALFIVLFTSRAAGRAKAARLVQEYTNRIVENASLMLVRFSRYKLAFLSKL